ncbi:MAG: MtrB/PioB family decaheme-associated outer membrane protein [Candidatus Latescibacteria bacterium]|nr:MtrB/PioB family decaheme-associated outer membrane protein [Candidatus Latescibacterota bacterium]
MKRRITLRALIGALTAALMLAASGGLVRAQTIKNGHVEIGQQRLEGDRSSSKFEEYRHIPSGLFLNRLYLNLGDQKNHRYFQLWATRPAQENQSVFLQTGLTGKVALEVQWDQTPHFLSMTGRSLFAPSTAGVFTLPTQTRQDLNKLVTTDTNPAVAGVQPDMTAIGNLVNGTARGFDLRTQRKTGKVLLRYTPAQEWDVRLQYSVENRTGSKPLGTNFGFNSTELPEPIDYRTQELKASSEYATKRWDARFAYTNAAFNNDVKALVWDNPFITVEKVASPSRGRLASFPDNTAQNLAFAGAINLPKASRLATTVSYGWRRQNEPFLPLTINSAVAALSTYPALPATSLSGKVNILNTNITLTSRPYRRVSVNARYRLYDYANKTPSLTFAKYVSYDNGLSGDARRSLPIAHTRQNAGLDVGWQFSRGASLKVGYGWENWERTYRDAPKVDEQTLQAALNLTPTNWFVLRTSYARSDRKTHEYDAEEHVAHFTYPQGESGLGQISELRKYDMAARTRDRVMAVAQVTPVDVLSFSASVGYANDDFTKSAYGLLGDRNNNVSFEVSYNPVARFALFTNYTREDYKYQQKSRQRTPASGSNPANDKPANDWQSDLADKANTFEAGIDGVLINNRLDTTLSYALSDVKGTIATRTLGATDLVTTAANYPDTKSKIHQVAAALRYHLSDSVTPRLEYRYERYEATHFAQQNLNPFMGAVDSGTSSSAFLGATQPGYKAHIISFLIGYWF